MFLVWVAGAKLPSREAIPVVTQQPGSCILAWSQLPDSLAGVSSQTDLDVVSLWFSFPVLGVCMLGRAPPGRCFQHALDPFLPRLDGTIVRGVDPTLPFSEFCLPAAYLRPWSDSFRVSVLCEAGR